MTGPLFLAPVSSSWEKNGTSPLGIAKRLGYISVIDVLKLVTEESVSVVRAAVAVVTPSPRGRPDSPVGLSLPRPLPGHHREALDELPRDGGRDPGRLRGRGWVFGASRRFLPEQGGEGNAVSLCFVGVAQLTLGRPSLFLSRLSVTNRLPLFSVPLTRLLSLSFPSR